MIWHLTQGFKILEISSKVITGFSNVRGNQIPHTNRRQPNLMTEAKQTNVHPARFKLRPFVGNEI